MTIVRAWAPRWLRAVALAAALLYLASVWLEAIGVALPTPQPVRFFTQVAQLFPFAARFTIEWRAKGYRCATRTFEEIDLRPHFPIRANDKENRFDRAMFFYLKNRRVLEALDTFISERESRLGPEHRLGGVMLVSVRVPIPEPGQSVPRYRHLPLDGFPKEYERKYWYVTGPDERERRCTGTP
jgi:hypothetical protein